MNNERRKAFGFIGGFFALMLGLAPLEAEARRGRRRSSTRRRRYSTSYSSSYRSVSNNNYRSTNSRRHSSIKAYVVTASSLNVRSEPTPDSKVLGKVVRGQKLSVLSSDNALFYKINFNEQIGYVSKKYVRYQ
ncbi:SH3 domain-containing protein [Photobacterium leiognathi]|uniref:SH3 domain-containing protein n=1 Tax=Photobacterium leiognathi TaxID=553611 RepID=UPI002981442C|nr:SH3 domain-containing protein [Photobacterium leiognathi]